MINHALVHLLEKVHTRSIYARCEMLMEFDGTNLLTIITGDARNISSVTHTRGAIVAHTHLEDTFPSASDYIQCILTARKYDVPQHYVITPNYIFGYCALPNAPILDNNSSASMYAHRIWNVQQKYVDEDEHILQQQHMYTYQSDMKLLGISVHVKFR